MSKSQHKSKPRQPRLRASCDGCFIAKVKCNKERPICSRCLTTGAECGYSPSSRAGKPKVVSVLPTMENSIPEMLDNNVLFPGGYDNRDAYTSMSSAQSSVSPGFTIDPRWGTLEVRFDNSSIRGASMSGSSPSTSHDENMTGGLGGGSSANGFRPPLSWTFPNQFSDKNPGSTLHSGQRSKSTSAVPLVTGSSSWFQDQNQQEPFSATDSIPGQDFLQSDFYMSSTIALNSSSCDCFTESLQSLQRLHHFANRIESSPPFDVVLTVNRRAMESCAITLDCGQCIGKPNSNTTLMILATIIGKVVSFYRAASQTYFGFALDASRQPQPLPLTFGSYEIPGEDGRWLEMEILIRELRKVEEVFIKFQQTVKGDETDEYSGVHTAVMGYLRQALNVTFQVLNLRRGK